MRLKAEGLVRGASSEFLALNQKEKSRTPQKGCKLESEEQRFTGCVFLVPNTWDQKCFGLQKFSDFQIFAYT
jgi:hypothetical protein